MRRTWTRDLLSRLKWQGILAIYYIDFLGNSEGIGQGDFEKVEE